MSIHRLGYVEQAPAIKAKDVVTSFDLDDPVEVVEKSKPEQVLAKL